MTPADEHAEHDYQRFIVLTRSRTGSNMLVSMLDSHEHIVARGELVARVGDRTAPAILDDFFVPRGPQVRACGFKVFYYHPLDDDTDALWDYLAGIEDLAVIHLRRRNILRTHLSRAIAAQQDVWQIRDPRERSEVDERRVVLDPEEVEETFRQTRRWEEWGRTHFTLRPFLEVVYEDVLADTSAHFARLCDLLGVPFSEPRTALSRQNPEPLEKLVKNHAELVERFSGTEWESFLWEQH